LTITRTDRQGFQFGGADQVPGRFRKRQLQAENLRTAQQFIQSQGGRVEARLRGFVDAVPDGLRHLRAEVRQALSHRLANGAKADQADAGGLELTDPRLVFLQTCIVGKWPPLVDMAAGRKRRRTVSISNRVCSATVTVFQPGLLAACTPPAPAPVWTRPSATRRCTGFQTMSRPSDEPSVARSGSPGPPCGEQAWRSAQVLVEECHHKTHDLLSRPGPTRAGVAEDDRSP
jgi:hypothetical protein